MEWGRSAVCALSVRGKVKATRVQCELRNQLRGRHFFRSAAISRSPRDAHAPPTGWRDRFQDSLAASRAMRKSCAPHLTQSRDFSRGDASDDCVSLLRGAARIAVHVDDRGDANWRQPQCLVSLRRFLVGVSVHGRVVERVVEIESPHFSKCGDAEPAAAISGVSR